VTAVANTMTVSAAPGTVAVPLQSGAGCALCRWDANETPTVATAPPTGNSRIDLVIVQVRDNALDAGANNDFIVTTVTGTPAASNPAVPATPTNAYVLAQVLVPGAAANLNGATLTDRRLRSLGVPGAAGHISSNIQTVVSSAAETQIPMQLTDFLLGGTTKHADGFGLVVPLAGIYHVSVSFVLGTGGGPATVAVPLVQGLIRRNSVDVVTFTTMTSGTASYPGVSGGADLACAAGDELSLAAYQNSGASLGTLTNPSYVWIGAHLVMATF
jgi:hypothetical protein